MTRVKIEDLIVNKELTQSEEQSIVGGRHRRRPNWGLYFGGGRWGFHFGRRPYDYYHYNPYHHRPWGHHYDYHHRYGH